jgi:hypothetical protein
LVQSKRLVVLIPVELHDARPLEAPVAPELLLPEPDELPLDELLLLLLLPLLEVELVPDELLPLLELDAPDELPELELLPLVVPPPPLCLVQVVQLPGSPWTGVSEIESKQPIETVARESASATRRGRMPTVSVGSCRKVKSTTIAPGRSGGEAGREAGG